MTRPPAQIIVAAGPPQTAEGLFKSARGFHAAAARLEQSQRAVIRAPRTAIDQDYLDELMGLSAGAVVLEALAIELLLKARLLRAGLGPVDRIHNHSALFARLPRKEQEEAEQQFQTYRNIPMVRTTLIDVLNFSSNAFEKWRYLHEQHHVEASMGEMQRAFAALAHGMTAPE